MHLVGEIKWVYWSKKMHRMDNSETNKQTTCLTNKRKLTATDTVLDKLVVFFSYWDIPYILRNLEAHYQARNSPPLAPTPNQTNLLLVTPFYLLIYIIILLHLYLELPSGLFLSDFITKILYTFFFSPTHPTHLILIDFIIQNNVW